MGGIFFSGVALAQTAETDLCHQLTTRCDTDSVEIKTLYLDVNALAFFKDNEFDGNIAKGYTLPGVRLTPYLAYRPLPNLNLQLGLTALCYDGTNYYPNYDIVTWKGNAYQGFAHALPFFRAALQMGAATLVLGDLYGGANHNLILPLYNPETLLTTDPEKGFQTIIARVTGRWMRGLIGKVSSTRWTSIKRLSRWACRKSCIFSNHMLMDGRSICQCK